MSVVVEWTATEIRCSRLCECYGPCEWATIDDAGRVVPGCGCPALGGSNDGEAKDEH
jgi:hypothetical protein